jgi:hypothetical protein
MSDDEAVLTANEAFYRAFSERDLAAMEALWSHRSPVACVHPGWNALTDREAVMASWAGILRSPSAPRVRCLDPTVYVTGKTAFVVCYEAIRGGFLVATNIFAREDEGWRILHHQAGQTAQPPPAAAAAGDGDTVH